jgi:uncharacterized repeat protein (TIGR01451 family)
MLLAADLGAIAGLVMSNAGGSAEAVSGIVMTLHGDNGDGVFDPGMDVLLDSTMTASDGRYRFDNLVAGSYFVHQGAFLVGSATMPASTSNAITITPTDAEGTMHTIIDAFDSTQQIARALSSMPSATSTASASEAIGGFRKLLATLDQPFGTVALAANDPDSGLARLDFSATSTATGSRRVTWDGTGSAADTTNYTGLGGIDLTNGGRNIGLSLAINADKSGSVTLRLYTDAVNYSTAVVVFPDTLGSLTQVFVPFSSLVATGAGATLTNLGAIQMDIDAASAAADGYIEVLGGFGPTVQTVNFFNQAIDLAITKTVDETRPQLNGQVTFTVTVSNQGVVDATGVQVLDVLPDGLSFVSAQATQGSFNPAIGLWQVGTVEASESHTLAVVATVTSPGTKTNIAQVWAANEPDIDSTPGNGNPTEDDQAQVSVTPIVIDLELTKVVNVSSPLLNETVTFTITVGNTGPDMATGVSVLDLLPAGLVFQSASANVGTYDAITGIWALGTLAIGHYETLFISARVTTPGTKVNTAQVLSANEYDIDSTPGNGNPAEDDQASAQVTPIMPPPPPPPLPIPPVVPPTPPAPPAPPLPAIPAPTPGRFNKLRFLAR